MGRPPTSGYCGTCRKRRIKCGMSFCSCHPSPLCPQSPDCGIRRGSDKTTPSCLRCQKSGYDCKGYDLGLRIQSLVVVTEPEGSQRLARIVLPPSSQQRLSRHRPEHLHVDHDHDQHGSPKAGPPPEMPLSAFHENMAFSYFFATYGWAYFWKPFLQLARETDLAPTASHMCSLALAYGHMGNSHANKSLKSMGLELYGRSLREVQTLLTRGAEARVELARLCVPIVILGMYSVSDTGGTCCFTRGIPSADKQTMQFAIDGDFRLIHNLGIAQILKHCGPQAFQQEPLLTAFRSCRALLVCLYSLFLPSLRHSMPCC